MRAALPAAILALAGSTNAFIRMGCNGPLTTERLDPIVSPGAVSGHLHSVYGGSNFAPNMTFDQARAARCSTCQAVADSSDYWIPSLYYKGHGQNNFTLMGNGGIAAYYLQRYNSNSNKLTAFPAGFRMVAGTPSLRSFNASSLAQQAVSFVCLDYSGSGEGGQYNYLPTHHCPNGVRSQIFFPSCWDGVNLDSADHKSHVAYPDGMDHGDCPASHPVRLISLFIEAIWDTDPAKYPWYSDTPSGQPYVFSMGDGTGYGFHGDFFNGWDVDVLQMVTDKCTNLSGQTTDCPGLQLRSNDDMNNCVIAPQVQETIQSGLTALPGCNPVTYGPANAAPATCAAAAPPSILAAGAASFLKPVSGWTAVGCANDGGAQRVLPTRWTNGAMTVETCLAHCAASNNTYAGLEWSQECWCGNSLDSSTIGDYACNMPCQGAANEFCGASQRLAVYKKGAAPPASTSKPAPASTSTSPKPASTSSKPAATTVPPAVKPSTPASKTTAPAPAKTSTAPAAWQSKGCYWDTVNPRSLNGTARWTGNGKDMTVALCTAHCSAAGFKLAGVEWSTECFCGNALHGSFRTYDRECNMACVGDKKEKCGAGNRLNIYERPGANVMLPRASPEDALLADPPTPSVDGIEGTGRRAARHARRAALSHMRF